MIYYDLSIPFRSLVILGLFAAFCTGGCLLPSVIRRKRLLPGILVVPSVVCSGVLMILYTAEARATLRSLPLPPAAHWLCSRSVLLPLCVLIPVLVLYRILIRQEMIYRRNTITRSSIKEGIDKISSGLCFYQEGGRVILVNRQMHDLCFRISGKDLQNADVFWALLKNGTALENVQRIQFGSQPIFRLQDGTVWTFSQEKIGSICQLSAANTTRVQAVTEELKQKNTELAALNLRLRKYGENVDQLTRSRERLETKSRIHRELGQALLSSRRFLLSEEGNPEAPLELWRRSIAMLQMEADQKTAEKPLDMLERIAASTGIVTRITGPLPEREEIQRLFVQAAAETLTNAISHAQAKTLFIELSEDDLFCHVRFHNDGLCPREEITEGGGLGSLRKKIESEGGTMVVTSLPKFVLSITLPKGRREIP